MPKSAWQVETKKENIYDNEKQTWTAAYAICSASTTDIPCIFALHGCVPLEAPAERADNGDVKMCLAT
jgi:hypothetical protein